MSLTEPQSGTLRSQFKTVLSVVAICFIFILSRSAMSPLLLDIEAAFGVSHGEATRAFVAYTIGYALFLVLYSFGSQRLSHRWLIVVGALLGMAGNLVIAGAPVIGFVKLGLGLFGAGFGLFVPSSLNVITTIVERKDWQKAITMWEVSPHAGMLLAPLLVLWVRPMVAWRGVYVVLAAILGLGAVLYGTFIRAGNFRGHGPKLETVRALFAQPIFYLLILYFSLALGSVDGIYLLIPTFLIAEVGVEPTVANSVFSVSRLLPIVALLLAVPIADRIGPKRTILFSLGGAGLFTVMLGLTHGPLLTTAVFLQPSLGALFFPAGLAALSGLLPAESRNVGFSLVLPLAIILGTGLIPAFIGHLGDTASFAAAFRIVGSFVAVMGLSVLLVKVEK